MDGDTTDASGNATPVTNVGGLVTASTQAKFGSSIELPSGTAGNAYLRSEGPAYDMGTGDYTIEGWFNASELDHGNALFTLIDSSGTVQVSVEHYLDTGQAMIFSGIGDPIAVLPDVFVANQWQHVAVVRDTSTGTFRLFVDGSERGTIADNIADHDAVRLDIGSWGTDASRQFVGNIDEFRVTKGVARYSADFTAPTEPFPDTPVIPTEGNDIITGSEDADTIDGLGGNDIISGGGGSDLLIGGGGDDTYFLDRNSDADLIQNLGEGSSDDNVKYDTSIAQDQLWFRQIGDDLQASVIGTESSVTIQDWYTDNDNRVSEFEAGDGTTLNATNVQALVDAMASFTPPALGETELAQSLHDQLDSIISANWQSP